MKKVAEWLNELPEPYRTQAFVSTALFHGDNTDEYINTEKDSMYETLVSAFDWRMAIGGTAKYWADLAMLYYEPR